MKTYVSELNLDYDPFEPDVPGKDFYAGGERRLLVDQILELALESNMMAVVSGAEGSGKTTIAEELRRCFGNDAVCIYIPATLFMSEDQFLDAIGRQLPKHKHISAIPSVEAGITRLRQLAAELDLEAQSLILIVDDANELSADVLSMLDDIVQGGSSKSSIRAILLGEKQLINLLHNTLSEASQANLAHFELAGFDTEDTLEYIGFKLGNAGMDSPVPFAEERIAEIQQVTNGFPGAINAHVADSLEAGDYGSISRMETALDADDTEVSDDQFETDDFELEEDQFSFDAQDHMQFDLDMADEDEPESSMYSDSADSDDEEVEVTAAQLSDYVSQYRYQIGASMLALVLLVTLFMWNTDTSTTAEIVVVQQGNAASPDSSSDVVTGGINRIQLAPPVTTTTVAAESVVSQSASLVATEEKIDPAPQQAPGSEVAATVTTPPAAGESDIEVKPASTPVVETSALAVSSSESEPATKLAGVASTTTAKPVASPAVAAVANTPEPVVSNLSGFEQELLGYAANSYTIQILGSHSEANVQKFVAGKSVSGKHGYYETRHQNKPWFVVVAGNYNDRSAANAVIAQLPAELRNMQPWIRTVGDIQRDIRQLRN